MSSLYIPGRGTMDTNVWRIEQAVNAYDERLFFQRNEQTGDWCVYIRMPSPEPPYPVIGFGTEIPALDDVMYRIQKADSMKHGNQIYADMIKSQREYRNNLDKMAAAASTEAAEPVEFLMRKHGKSPVVKVFYNSKGGAASDD